MDSLHGHTLAFIFEKKKLTYDTDWGQTSALF